MNKKYSTIFDDIEVSARDEVLKGAAVWQPNVLLVGPELRWFANGIKNQCIVVAALYSSKMALSSPHHWFR